MFAESPTKQKEDYAKWQLEDPAVNFAISTRGNKTGLDHLGIQVSSEEELNQINERLNTAQIDAGKIENTTCCYAESVKFWSFDPAGIPWESFITMKDADAYGTDTDNISSSQTNCCPGAAPQQSTGASCC